MIFFDTFKNKKSFLIEKDFINKFNKNTNYSDYLNKINFKKNVHIKGNYEDELFFISNRNELKKIFTIHDKYQSTNSQLINLMKNTNSVSIHVRQNRFSDQNFMLNKISLSKKSKMFTEKNLKYIDKSIEYLNSKFNDLTYFVWSNDFNGLENYFLKYKKNKIYFVKNNNVINDFDLLKYPKYFIVGPSTFHWWGAWLNDNENKVCLCPKDINPSNNINFWPKNWIKI